jgi:hypothetical protein
LLSEFVVDRMRAQGDGMVTLVGTPENNELGRGIVCRAGHVQGVVAVQDRLSCLVQEVRWMARGAMA